MQPLYEQARSGDVFRPVKSQEGAEIGQRRNEAMSEDVPASIMTREKARGRTEEQVKKAWQAYNKEKK